MGLKIDFIDCEKCNHKMDKCTCIRCDNCKSIMDEINRACECNAWCDYCGAKIGTYIYEHLGIDPTYWFGVSSIIKLVGVEDGTFKIWFDRETSTQVKCVIQIDDERISP